MIISGISFFTRSSEDGTILHVDRKLKASEVVELTVRSIQNNWSSGTVCAIDGATIRLPEGVPLDKLYLCCLDRFGRRLFYGPLEKQKQSSGKVISLGRIFLIGLISLAGLILGYLLLTQEEDDLEILAVGGAHLRSSPLINRENIVKVLQFRTSVNVEKKFGEFLKVKIKDATNGYVSGYVHENVVATKSRLDEFSKIDSLVYAKSIIDGNTIVTQGGGGSSVLAKLVSVDNDFGSYLLFLKAEAEARETKKPDREMNKFFYYLAITTNKEDDSVIYHKAAAVANPESEIDLIGWCFGALKITGKSDEVCLKKLLHINSRSFKTWVVAAHYILDVKGDLSRAKTVLTYAMKLSNSDFQKIGKEKYFERLLPEFKGLWAMVVSEPPITMGFWLQFGAFVQKDKMEALKTDVGATLPWITPFLSVFHDGSFYRLQAGPYRSKEDASITAGRVQVDSQWKPVILERR